MTGIRTVSQVLENDIEKKKMATSTEKSACTPLRSEANARCPHTLAPEDRTRRTISLPWPFNQSTAGSLYFSLGLSLIVVVLYHATQLTQRAPNSSEITLGVGITIVTGYQIFRAARYCRTRLGAKALIFVGAGGRVLRFRVERESGAAAGPGVSTATALRFVELEPVACARGPHVRAVVRTHVSATENCVYAANEVNRDRAERLMASAASSASADGAAAAAAAAPPLPAWAAAICDPHGAVHVEEPTLVGFALNVRTGDLVEESLAACSAKCACGGALLADGKLLFSGSTDADALAAYYRDASSGAIEARASITKLTALAGSASAHGGSPDAAAPTPRLDGLAVAVEPRRRRVLLAVDGRANAVRMLAIHHDLGKLLEAGNVALPPSSTAPRAVAWSDDARLALVLCESTLCCLAIDQGDGMIDGAKEATACALGNGASASADADGDGAVAMATWAGRRGGSSGGKGATTVACVALRGGGIVLLSCAADRDGGISVVGRAAPPKTVVGGTARGIAMLRSSTHTRLAIVLVVRGGSSKGGGGGDGSALVVYECTVGGDVATHVATVELRSDCGVPASLCAVGSL